jgi:hypothetical protein
VIQHFALAQKTEIFLKVLLCNTFKNISVLLKASISCNVNRRRSQKLIALIAKE